MLKLYKTTSPQKLLRTWLTASGSDGVIRHFEENADILKKIRRFSVDALEQFLHNLQDRKHDTEYDLVDR